ncbi:MAG: hypothetical protein DSZ29_07930 [Aquificaceae bacterium]|nr:MAG: hypothetical protein DSZ29_07930 [Aquificaceae bacterium]
MKTNNKLKALIALAVFPLFSNVYADLPSNPFNYAKASAAYVDATNTATGMMERIYFGGSFGASEADNYCEITKGCADKDSSWKAFAGYKINELLSAEAAYTSIGDLHKAGAASDISALSVAGVANLPINDQFGIFGKAGFSRWTSENTDSKKSGTGLTYGVGAKVNLSESMKLRAEWERLPSIETSNTEETDINMLSVGIELSTF